MSGQPSYAEPTLRGEIELVLQEEEEMTIQDLAERVDAEIRDVVHQLKKLNAEGKVFFRKAWPYGRSLVTWG